MAFFQLSRGTILTFLSLERRNTLSKRTTSWTGTLHVSTSPDELKPGTVIGCVDTNGRLAIPSSCALMTIELFELGLLVRSTAGYCGYINNKLACANTVLDLLILPVSKAVRSEHEEETSANVDVTQGPGPNSVSTIANLYYDSVPTIGNATNIYHGMEENLQRRGAYVSRGLGTMFLGYIPCC
jgi:hypothetical protein